MNVKSNTRVIISLTLLSLLSSYVMKTESKEFTTIGKGYHSAITTPVADVFYAPESFESFWKNHMSNQSPPPPVPDVNFGTEIVVILFRGEFETGGYDIEITSVEETESEIIIHANTSDPDPFSMTTMALTQPYHMVTIETSNKPVTFKVKKVQYPLPFPVFIVVPNNKDDLNDLAEDVEGLEAVHHVDILGGLGMLFVYFDEDAISAQDAMDLLSETLDDVKYIEADPPISEGSGYDEVVMTDDPMFDGNQSWEGGNQSGDGGNQSGDGGNQTWSGGNQTWNGGNTTWVCIIVLLYHNILGCL